MTLFLDEASTTSAQHDPGQAPRVLYVDGDTDLPGLLDRVDEDSSPAILVLEDNARPLRGTVAARLLQRRVAAAAIPLVVVTADRATIAQLKAVGIPTAATVGDARRLLVPEQPVEAADALPAWDSDPDAEILDDVPQIAVPQVSPGSSSRSAAPIASRAEHTLQEDQSSDSDEDDVILQPASVLVVRGAGPGAAQGGRRAIWLLVAVLAAIALAVGIWAFFFPQASIVISYSARSFDQTYHTVASPNGQIPLRTTQLVLQQTINVPATGSIQIPDGRASGAVALANPLDGAVHVPAGTTLTTVGGTAFTTVADVVVPAAVHTFDGSTNGQQSVQIQALLRGPASNVPAGTIARIDGRLAGVLLVTNYSPTAGGTLRTVYHVTALDIAHATGSLTASLKSRAVQQLREKFARSPNRAITGSSFSAPHVVTVTDHGRLYARVSLTTRYTMQYLHAEDIQRFASSKRTIDLSGRNLSVVQGSEHVLLVVSRNRGLFVVSAHVRAQVIPQIDLTNLSGLLAGRTIDAARTLLDGSARYGAWQYTISTSPNWAGRLPQLTSFIHITLHQIG